MARRAIDRHRRRAVTARVRAQAAGGTGRFQAVEVLAQAVTEQRRELLRGRLGSFLGAFDRDHLAGCLHACLRRGFRRARRQHGGIADLELGHTAWCGIVRHAHRRGAAGRYRDRPGVLGLDLGQGTIDRPTTHVAMQPPEHTGCRVGNVQRRPCVDENFVTPLSKVPEIVTLSSPAGSFNWSATKT